MSATRDWRRIEAVCWVALGTVAVTLGVAVAGPESVIGTVPVVALIGTVLVLTRSWNRHRPCIVRKDEFGRPVSLDWKDLTL